MDNIRNTQYVRGFFAIHVMNKVWFFRVKCGNEILATDETRIITEWRGARWQDGYFN